MRGPFLRPLLVATAVAMAAVGIYVAAPTGPPPVPPTGTLANLWVNTTAGTCTRSSTQVVYSAGAACGTISSAVAAANIGDRVAVESGDYPFESILYRSGLQNLSPGCDPHGEWGSATTANCVEITPDSGANVTIRGLNNAASSLWLHGHVTNWDGVTTTRAALAARTFDFHVTKSDLIGNPPPGAATDANCNCKSTQFAIARPAITSSTAQRVDHVVAEGIDSDTADIYSGLNIELLNSDVGPMWDDTSIRGDASGSGPDVPRIWWIGSGGGAPANIVWDGVFVHEMNRTFWCAVSNVCHPDGLYINSGGPITIRNTGFSQVAGQQLFFENFSGNPDITNFTMSNTWIGCVVGDYPASPATARTTCGTNESIDIKNCGSTCNGMLFKYNAWYGLVGAETSFTNTRFIGNAGRQPSGSIAACSQTWSDNAFFTVSGGSNCGASNVNTGSNAIDSLFANSLTPGSEDFHLAGAAGSTVADNLVPVGGGDFAIGFDFDGQARPIGAANDAGVDER